MFDSHGGFESDSFDSIEFYFCVFFPPPPFYLSACFMVVSNITPLILLHLFLCILPPPFPFPLGYMVRNDRCVIFFPFSKCLIHGGFKSNSFDSRAFISVYSSPPPSFPLGYMVWDDLVWFPSHYLNAWFIGFLHCISLYSPPLFLSSSIWFEIIIFIFCIPDDTMQASLMHSCLYVRTLFSSLIVGTLVTPLPVFCGGLCLPSLGVDNEGA